MKRKITLLLAVMVCALLMLAAAGCKNDPNKSKIDAGLIPFPANSGEYAAWLKPEWRYVSSGDNDRKLTLLNNETSILLNIDLMSKKELSDAGVSSVEGYRDMYEKAGALEAYYNGAEVTEFVSEKLKNTKGLIRRQISADSIMPEDNGVTEHPIKIMGEIIYFEADDYYLAVYYSCEDSRFEDMKAAVNSMIENFEFYENPTTGARLY